MNKRVIFHIDLDAFFASSEERENPHFRGKPVVVGADPHSPAGKGRGRGVVSTANYEARKYGIQSAMPISRAWQLCPDAIFLPVNFSLYSRVSNSVMAIISDTAKKYNGEFKQVGIDEAYIEIPYIEISHIHNIHDREYYVYGIARGIKENIKAKEKITASVGVGPNMLIAKIASDFKKPDGLTIVPPEKVQEFLDPMDIRKIPGIGPKTETILKKLKVNTVFDLRQLDQSYLLGEHGISLYNSARGIDEREMALERKTKSISKDYTFPSDVADLSRILPKFFPMVGEVLKLAKMEGFENFKTVTIRVRFSDFKTHTKSVSGNYSANDGAFMEKQALRLLWKFIPHSRSIGEGPQNRKKIRLIGFRISGFV